MNRFLKVLASVMLIVAVVCAAGCKKNDASNNESGNNGNNGGGGGNSNSDVRVTTYTPQDVTATTAVCGGDVIVTEGLTLTEIGVCWSTSGNPTPDGDHLSTDNWNEPFVCTLTGLEPNTRYYVRAYALRGLEYYYGTMKSFTTQAGGGGGGEIGYPSISVLQEEGYVQDGDVVDLDVEVPFGFQMASNTMTGKELKTLVIGIGDVYETYDLTGLTEYTYRDVVVFAFEAKEIIGEVTITATVTDVVGNSAAASMSLLINQPAQPLEQVPFEWVRQGHDSLNEEEMARCGLFWSSNSKDIFANIKPLDGAILYVCYGDDFEYITTDVEKAAYITNLAENGIPVESYRNVSCTMNANYNDMLAVIAPDGGMHLIHVMYGRVEVTASGTRVSISGELK